MARALTDHDTIAGVAEARAQSERRGMRYIAGVEISAEWNGQTLHIIGLDVEGRQSGRGCHQHQHFERRRNLEGLRGGRRNVADQWGLRAADELFVTRVIHCLPRDAGQFGCV